ncbi:MAG: hypothetical protein ACPLZ9_04985 [Candidatus Ratteibacteria bacterium]
MMKWEIVKEKEKVLLKVRHYASNKEWACIIEGKDPVYKFKRNFLRVYEKDWSGSGRTGYSYFDVTNDGLYQFKNPFDDVYFLKIEGGHWETLNNQEVEEYLNKEVKNGN